MLKHIITSLFIVYYILDIDNLETNLEKNKAKQAYELSWSLFIK